MRRSLAIAALVLAGCASAPAGDRRRIDYSVPPPADWPALAIEVQHVPPDVMAASCPKSASAIPAGRLWGCSVINLCARRCRVFISDKVPSEQKRNEVLEHEQAHCRGYDHYGSSAFREAWARAKANGCGR